jgi:hypothetical protein
LTTPAGTPGEGIPATRRGGIRREVTARVKLKPRSVTIPEGEPYDGWALNVSRGGVRVILEVKVELGTEFDIELQGESGLDVTRAGRVVWLQDEPDGTIVGIEFLGDLPSEPPRA